MEAEKQVLAEANANQGKNKKKRNKKNIAALIILLAGNALFLLTIWLASKYDRVTLDQFVYQMKSSAIGTIPSLTGSVIFTVGVLGVLITAVEAVLFMFLTGKIGKRFHENKIYKKLSGNCINRFVIKRVLPLTLAVLIISTIFFTVKLNVVHYVSALATDSTFVEDNYVDPNTVDLKFPEKKRNLIYIFLESMEVAFSDPAVGGPVTENYIPELTALCEQNVCFSNDEDVGGAISFPGTTWTAAAMVTQTSGVVVQVPLNAGEFGGTDEDSQFMPGVVSIGEVLEDAGYNQTILMGSDSYFAGRDTYFSKHGNYNIVDTKSLKAEGRLAEDYRVWWGFEDNKLWEYAKEELLTLSQADEPFNLTLLTCDSHFPSGYVCEDCGDEYDAQYPCVLRCCSRKTVEFIRWVQAQPFYENTTIVLCGDHLTMDPHFFGDANEDYERTVYNCIINPAVEPVNTKNRLFGTFDMFPTTLAAMGVEIPGERLGLGTNLFSDRKTVAEQYGVDYVYGELEKNSVYYNSKLLEMYPMPKNEEE